MVTAANLERRLADLLPIGRDETGATTRLAWTEEDEAAAGWFARRAAELGRRMDRDPAGNLWACPDAPGPWWAAGSHLDTVRGGGRFDGALGVAAAFAVAERCSAPLAVISFADEEGARFNTPTFGSRALTGRLDCADAIDRVDEHGVALGDAMAGAGVDPDALGTAPEWLGRLRGFLELHVDQTRDLRVAGAPAGVVSRLAARLRLQAALTGRADHAGTTPRAERRDALAAAARLIVRGEDLAAEEMVFTAARIEVEPNSPTTVPSAVRLWLDARAPHAAAVETWRSALAGEADALAERTGVAIELRTAARSDGVEFAADVRAALLAGLDGRAPELVCLAGHDAGILAERIPAGMVLVRNPTGISHAPEEDVDLEDAATGATALLAAVERLAA
jgi:beta-ureidopropionase / N-carbamoyl-L-amino-acid hydrolase